MVELFKAVWPMLAMVAMVAVVLVQALRHGRDRAPVSDREADLAVYRSQLAEVDQDLARGVLAAPEAERLRIEVQRRLLEADRRQATSTGARTGRQTLWGGTVVLALLGALGLYVDLGAPGYQDLPLAARFAQAEAEYQNRPSQEVAEAAQPPFTPPADLDPETARLLDALRAAVATRPDDLQGHVLLAQNEAAIGNFAAARKAQEVVLRLKGDQAGAEEMAFQTWLMVNAAGGIVTPEAEQVVIRTLQVEPTNGWARYYSGLLFAQTGRPDRTFTLWEPLLTESPADAPYLEPIRAMIEDVAQAAGVAFTLRAAAPGPDAADMEAAAQMSEGDRAEMIRSMVEGLEGRLAEQGGTVEEWGRLITSLGVLGETDRARAAYAAARAAFEGKPGELSALQAAAEQAGVAE